MSSATIAMATVAGSMQGAAKHIAQEARARVVGRQNRAVTLSCVKSRAPHAAMTSAILIDRAAHCRGTLVVRSSRVSVMHKLKGNGSTMLMHLACVIINDMLQSQLWTTAPAP
eukprot:6197226-Pleurochrysis_carterae.AAC.2